MRRTRRFLWIVPCLCVVLALPVIADTDVRLANTINISSKISAVGGMPASVRISDVSSDASVVVGMFSQDKDRFETWHVFRYSKTGGIENLGQLAKNINNLCISADGAVIWGSFFVKDEGSRLFRHTRSGGIQDLGTLGRTSITPYAASADGSVVVGSFLHSTTPEKKPIYHAFMYSEAHGFEDLGAMGGESAFARGVSADGAVIVGNVQVPNGSGYAFQYSRRDRAKSLSSVNRKITFATGVSKQGLIVGTYFASLDFYWQKYRNHVFLYSQSGGFKKLGAMGGTSVGVVRVSPDADQIVGSYTNSTRDSYVYTAAIK